MRIMDVKEVMDVTRLMNSMKLISENLGVVPTNDCSDEFLAALEELIKKATDMSLHIKKRKLSRQKRVSRTFSSSSEDVTCITDIETIEVDSDSDNLENMIDVSNSSSQIQSTENLNNVSIPSSTIQSRENVNNVSVSSATPSKSTTQSKSYKRIVKPAVILKRFNVNDVSRTLQKRCTVKLHRISAAELLRIHGLDQNVVAVNDDIVGSFVHGKGEKTKRLRRDTQYPRKFMPNNNNSK